MGMGPTEAALSYTIEYDVDPAVKAQGKLRSALNQMDMMATALAQKTINGKRALVDAASNAANAMIIFAMKVKRAFMSIANPMAAFMMTATRGFMSIGRGYKDIFTQQDKIDKSWFKSKQSIQTYERSMISLGQEYKRHGKAMEAQLSTWEKLIKKAKDYKEVIAGTIAGSAVVALGAKGAMNDAALTPLRQNTNLPESFIKNLPALTQRIASNTGVQASKDDIASLILREGSRTGGDVAKTMQGVVQMLEMRGLDSNMSPDEMYDKYTQLRTVLGNTGMSGVLGATQTAGRMGLGGKAPSMLSQTIEDFDQGGAFETVPTQARSQFLKQRLAYGAAAASQGIDPNTMNDFAKSVLVAMTTGDSETLSLVGLAGNPGGITKVMAMMKSGDYIGALDAITKGAGQQMSHMGDYQKEIFKTKFHMSPEMLRQLGPSGTMQGARDILSAEESHKQADVVISDLDRMHKSLDQLRIPFTQIGTAINSWGTHRAANILERVSNKALSIWDAFYGKDSDPKSAHMRKTTLTATILGTAIAGPIGGAIATGVGRMVGDPSLKIPGLMAAGGILGYILFGSKIKKMVLGGIFNHFFGDATKALKASTVGRLSSWFLEKGAEMEGGFMKVTTRTLGRVFQYFNEGMMKTIFSIGKDTKFVQWLISIGAKVSSLVTKFKSLTAIEALMTPVSSAVRGLIAPVEKLAHLGGLAAIAFDSIFMAKDMKKSKALEPFAQFVSSVVDIFTVGWTKGFGAMEDVIVSRFHEMVMNLFDFMQRTMESFPWWAKMLVGGGGNVHKILESTRSTYASASAIEQSSLATSKAERDAKAAGKSNLQQVIAGARAGLNQQAAIHAAGVGADFSGATGGGSSIAEKNPGFWGKFKKFTSGAFTMSGEASARKDIGSVAPLIFGTQPSSEKGLGEVLAGTLGVSSPLAGIPKYRDPADDAGIATMASTSNGKSSSLDSMITTAANKYGVDPDVIRAMVHAESAGDPNAVSNKGALGLLQLMPKTAAGMGYSTTDLKDPQKNLDAGVQYFSQQMKTFGNNIPLALSAYNAGPGATMKAGGVANNPETQSYVSSIMKDIGKMKAAENADVVAQLKKIHEELEKQTKQGSTDSPAAVPSYPGSDAAAMTAGFGL